MKRLPVALLRNDGQNTEMEGDVTGSTCPGARCSVLHAASQNRDRPKRGVFDGPGSAVHHAEKRRAAPRPGHETSRPLRHLLLLAGENFRRHRALESIAYLQALPISRDVGPEIFCQPD